MFQCSLCDFKGKQGDFKAHILDRHVDSLTTKFMKEEASPKPAGGAGVASSVDLKQDRIATKKNSQ